MPIQIEYMKDEPIIVYHWPEKLESNQEIRDALEESTVHARNMPDPIIWFIHDTSQLTVDFATLVSALVALTREGPEGFHDSRFLIAAISSSELIKLAARSASQKQYGSWNVSIFDTYEQALAHARVDLAQRREQG